MITILPSNPDSAVALPLLAALNATLTAITGDSGASSFNAAEMQEPGALFVIAQHADGEAQGCGALRPIADGIAEIKRMYAIPGSQGVGSAILRHLESQARAFGYREIRLATRLVNQRALAFYERHAYQRIANFGQYHGRAESACFSKFL